jgi:REP element-mobilizing transposase RayT
MKFLPENVYHVYNQGNNQQNVFIEDFHFLYFLQLYREYIVPNCETLAWCLMHNHFHFMLYADTRCLEIKKQGGLLLDPVTNGFRKLLSTYAHEFNIKNNRSGALFRPKTKAICLNDEAELNSQLLSKQDYYLNTFNYIHYNAVEAGIVQNAADWKWSSFRSYNGLRDNSICNKELAKQICGLV